MLDLKSAEQAATEDVVAIRSERDLLDVSGPDAESYLQGQVSQDISGLAVSATTWTLLLQPQGKVDSWLRVHRLAADRFMLDVEAGHGQHAIDRLKRFMLRVDMAIELVTAPILALRGPGATAAAESAAEGVLVLDATWAGIPGVDLVAGVTGGDHQAPAEAAADEADLGRWLRAEVASGPSELLEVLRVRQGRPAMGSELTESTIPAAAGVIEQSVDFTKGCYVGQELVARVDSRGNNTPTRLYGLRFDGPAVPAAGSELLLDGATAGTVTSVAVSPLLGGIGLGYIKRAVDVPAELEVTDEAGRTLRVHAVALPLQPLAP